MSNKKKSRLSFYLFICITAISLFLFTGCPDPIVAPTTETAGYFDVSLILVGSEGGVPYTKEVYFSETVNSVNVEVSNSLETVDIELLNEVSGADIKVNNRSLDMSSKVSVSLDTGSNEISIKVSPGSVDPFYYTLVIKRQLPNGQAFSSDAALSSLAITSVANSALQPAFSPDIFEYTTTVGVAIAEIAITAVSSDDMAVITMGTEVLTSGEETEPIAIVPGPNELEITVTAEDEITVSTYVLTVNRIEDNDDPVITRLGEHPMNVEVFTIFNDPGCTAYDATAGDLTYLIQPGGDTVDTNTLGTYTIIYTVSDASGNTASPVYRTVHVVDTTPPVIEVTGENAISIYPGHDYTELGATASDNYDDDTALTSQIVISGDIVNTSVEGIYHIYYDVTDSEGNDAVQKERLVRVTTEVDTEAPVITLVGDPEVTIEVTPQDSYSYDDDGATAEDNLDGDLTSIITVSGSVDSSVIGTYTISYDVYDTAGNDAETVTRTIHVVDTEAPVISINGGNTMEVEYNTPFTDPEATVTDNYDPDRTIEGSGSVDTLTLGSYDWIYSTTDSSGNPASATLTVNVVDTTAPVITNPAANTTIYIEYPGTYTELSPSAADNYDNNPVVVIGGDAVDTDTLGTYVVTYNCTDSEGNAAAERIRTVIVRDTTAPVITLSGDNPITFECGSDYTDAGATANDNYDNSLTVFSTSNVNDDSPGTYTVDYDVTDSNGNAAPTVSRTVNVVDTIDPEITLLGGAVTVEVGTDWAAYWPEPDSEYLIDDNNPETLSMTPVLSGLDMNTVGVQTLRYNLTDPSGNHADEVTRMVTVEDNVAPVITVGGSNPMTVDYGTVFTDGEVTASDNYDGDISGSIIVSGDTVNTSIIGDYVILYNVSDSSANDAEQRRTVYVRDLSAPVITLSGDNPVTIECLTAYSDAGATASDVHDGDLTASIVTTGGTIDTSLPDTHTVSYQVEDAAGNSTTATRTVNVVDTTIPVITLTAPTTLSVEVNSLWSDPGYSALDTVDGDITTDVVRSGPNMSILGTQTVSYNVSDLSGNEAVTVTRSVTTQDTTAPVITLNAGYGGTDEITINVDDEFSDPGATVYDNYDNYGSSWTIYGSGFVDTSIAGTYTLTYNSTDTHSNSAVPVIRTVIVQ